MTKFNPEGKETLTYQEALAPAMQITDKEDAKQYFAAYCKYMQFWLDKDPDLEGRTAEQIAKINIGYYAGYYSTETAKRVYELFETKHPFNLV